MSRTTAKKIRDRRRRRGRPRAKPVESKGPARLRVVDNHDDDPAWARPGWKRAGSEPVPDDGYREWVRAQEAAAAAAVVELDPLGDLLGWRSPIVACNLLGDRRR